MIHKEDLEEILITFEEKALQSSDETYKNAIFEVTSELRNRIEKQREVIGNHKLLEEFLAEKILSGCTKETLRNYRLEITKFLNFIQKPIEIINDEDIKQYISAMGHLKSNTISTKISIIKSFFTYLSEEEIIERNPARKLKRIKKEKRQPKYLNMTELLKLRESCTDIRTRALLEILFETGCRISEIISLNRDDINWENRSIKIFGKGSKDRIVYFHINTQFFLRKYLKSRNDNNPALFVNKTYPYNRMQPRTAQIAIKKLGKKANIMKNIHPHALRHTFSTYLLNKGMDIAIVGELLGHEQLSTTQIYAKLSENRKETEYNQHFA